MTENLSEAELNKIAVEETRVVAKSFSAGGPDGTANMLLAHLEEIETDVPRLNLFSACLIAALVEAIDLAKELSHG